MISINAVRLVVLGLGLIGINVSEEGLVEFISAVFTIISFLSLVVEQINRKDVTLFFWKKKE